MPIFPFDELRLAIFNQEDQEAKMDAALSAPNDEAQKYLLREMAHCINVARGETRKAKKARKDKLALAQEKRERMKLLINKLALAQANHLIKDLLDDFDDLDVLNEDDNYDDPSDDGPTEYDDYIRP